MIITGSRAFALRVPGMLLRKPKDFDFVCTQDELERWLNDNRSKLGPDVSVEPTSTGKVVVRGTSDCEFEIIRPGSSAELMEQLVRSDPTTIQTSMGLVPSLDMLFTIKKSHRHLKNSPHFWKTVADYHLMKRMGARIRPEFHDFLALRERETYAYKHPRLNQDKMGFFSGDQVTYVYDHDSVHRSVAVFDEPAYTLFQKDGAEVAVDRKKFEALPFERQIASVIEESAVLAIERSLVPYPGVMTPDQAWRFALMKVCTSITSGWWRDFAYENILEALRRYPTGYWEKFQRGVTDGTVVRL